MIDKPTPPIFPNTPLSTDELRLRHGQGKKTFTLPEPDYAKGAHVGPPYGRTCKCGSLRVYRVNSGDNLFIRELACMDCWRRWRG